jgi:hypothetical protein
MSRVIICVSKSKMISLTISIAATLQGRRGPPSLIYVDIEFYNETNEELTKGCVPICFGCVSFKDKSPDLPGLFVRASRLNPYVSVIPIYFTCSGSFPFLSLTSASYSCRENHSWILTPCYDERIPGLRGRCQSTTP